MTEQDYRNSLLNISRHGIFLGNKEIIGAYEKPTITKYVQYLCDTLKPQSVLEIGFGCGYTASIFRKHIKRHIIVELHPVLAQRGRDAGYNIIEGSIHSVKINEAFDLIWDDRTEVVFDPNDYSYKDRIKHKHFRHYGQCQDIG